MKVLLYFEGKRVISRSGIGRAMKHQMSALRTQGIDYTLSPREDYDILHLNTVGLGSARVAKQARRQGKRIICHAHSTEEDFRNSFVFSNQLAPLFRRWLVHIYNMGDAIITPTPYSKRLLESYGIQKPIHAVSNGIDVERFRQNAQKEEKFRAYFHLQPRQKCVVCVGLFFERKGILDFIEVAKRLPQYTFIWFGNVPLYSIPKKIRRIVKGGHPANVIFPGYVEGDVLEGAYSGADAFFFPSKEETEGIVVLEALASSQQVIVRDIPVFEDWLQDGVNCYKGHDVASFTHLVDAVVSRRLPDVGIAGRETARQRSIPEVGKQLRRIYEQVAKTKAG